MTLVPEKQSAVDPPLVPDEALVRATLAGDRQAFGSLVSRYERSVRGICWSVLRDHHLSRDAAQDAFVEAYRRLAGLRDAGAFAGWVMTIGRNRALRMGKSRQRERALPPDVAERRDPERDEELLLLVAKLPEQERTVIMLRFFQGCAVEGIATVLGRPVGTVTKQLSRAYERLRSELSSREDDA